MIGKRLEWFIENKLILSPFTCGFRKTQSCSDCLSRLVSYIQLGFSNKISTVACCIDIENAYNNISIDRMVTTLDKLGVGKRICNYIWSFLSNRQLKIKSSTMAQLTRYTNRGLAQGDPISPLLFNIATFEICTKIKNVCVMT